MSALEVTHLDVLQNIERSIVAVHRQSVQLSDYDIMRALDALIALYRAESRGHVPKQANLEDPEAIIFERVKAVCEWRIGRAEMPGDSVLFSGPEYSVDEILDCLRKVRKSVERWNKHGGPKGYLNFVSDYV
jgi:hypothetical protein